MPNAKTQTKAAKPAKLQVNLAGAWKDVAPFDAADEFASGAILDSANCIGMQASVDLRFRIVSAMDALPEPLMHWTRDDGWKEWRNAVR